MTLRASKPTPAVRASCSWGTVQSSHAQPTRTPLMKPVTKKASRFAPKHAGVNRVLCVDLSDMRIEAYGATAHLPAFLGREQPTRTRAPL